MQTIDIAILILLAFGAIRGFIKGFIFILSNVLIEFYLKYNQGSEKSDSVSKTNQLANEQQEDRGDAAKQVGVANSDGT